jgi:lysophospholipase L1-like esterase
MPLQQNDIILFQGDSVTDWGRDYNDPASLGHGYPLLIACALAAKYPKLKLTFLNRGVSGNRVADLAERWTRDCVNLRPTVLSVLIGINDTWRKFDSNDPTSASSFEKKYREILTRARDEAGVREFVLLEPFVLPTPSDRKLWRDDLNPRIIITRELALEFSATLIPTDGLFAAASMQREPSYWAADGVHPTIAGAGLIAGAWARAVTQ